MIRKYTLLFITALLGLAAGVTSCLTDDDETIALEGGVPEEILLGVWTIDDWLGPDPKGFGWDDLTAVRFNADGTFEITPDNGEKHYWKWKKNPYTGITDCISLDGYDFGWDSWGRGLWQVYFPYDATNGSDDAVCHVELSKNGTNHGGSGGIEDGITSPGNDEGGHYSGKYTAVDLGLPSGTRWATTNLGAASPEKYGDYFAWGETKAKNYYAWNTYFDSKDGKNFTKYKRNGKLVLDPADDAATVRWGKDWCMPSIEQFVELLQYCTWSLSKLNGRMGYLVKSKKNKNSIFLPFGAVFEDDKVDFIKDLGWGEYWTNELDPEAKYSEDAYSLDIDDEDEDYPGLVESGGRYAGLSIRPVRSGK